MRRRASSAPPPDRPARPAPARTALRQLAQGVQIAQLHAQQRSEAPLQLNGERKSKGFNRGKSHSSTTPNGKTTSHRSGKGREEDPRKSAALNRKRDRMLAANSKKKQPGSQP
jgi:hypothetical protein